MTTTASLPFLQGFTDDQSSLGCERHEKPYEFLIPGRTPKVGQRIQVYADLPPETFSFPLVRFSGIVTHVQSSSPSSSPSTDEEITVFAYLKIFDSETHQPPHYAAGRIYKIFLKWDEEMLNPWCVVSIHNATDMPVADLPDVFKAWENGRKHGMGAPFDQSPEERTEYAKQTARMFDQIKAIHN